MIFSNFVDRVQKSTLYNVLAVICVCYTIYSLIKSLVIWLNLWPGYYLEWHRVDSLEPVIYLFPGEQIRFDMEFYDSFPKKKISSASWKIIKGTKVVYNQDGLEPTFILPTTSGGIYKLQAEAMTVIGEKRKGESTFYVIQDEPIIKKIINPASIKLTPQDTSLSLLKSIQASGAEVYSGNGQWTTINVLSTNSGVDLSFKPNDDILLYRGNNKILFRSKNEINKLSSYGSANFSIKSQDQKNH